MEPSDTVDLVVYVEGSDISGSVRKGNCVFLATEVLHVFFRESDVHILSHSISTQFFFTIVKLKEEELLSRPCHAFSSSGLG